MEKLCLVLLGLFAVRHGEKGQKISGWKLRNIYNTA